MRVKRISAEEQRSDCSTAKRLNVKTAFCFYKVKLSRSRTQREVIHRVSVLERFNLLMKYSKTGTETKLAADSFDVVYEEMSTQNLI